MAIKLASPQQLREQAKRFREAATKMEEVADMLDGGSTSPAPEKSANGNGDEGGRRQQLINLLKEKGPLRRAEIAEALPKVPKGTLAYLLTQKSHFKRKYRKWHLVQ